MVVARPGDPARRECHGTFSNLAFLCILSEANRICRVPLTLHFAEYDFCRVQRFEDYALNGGWELPIMFGA